VKKGEREKETERERERERGKMASRRRRRSAAAFHCCTSLGKRRVLRSHTPHSSSPSFLSPFS
jgi:hypothetical protein